MCDGWRREWDKGRGVRVRLSRAGQGRPDLGLEDLATLERGSAPRPAPPQRAVAVHMVGERHRGAHHRGLGLPQQLPHDRTEVMASSSRAADIGAAGDLRTSITAVMRQVLPAEQPARTWLAPVGPPHDDAPAP